LVDQEALDGLLLQASEKGHTETVKVLEAAAAMLRRARARA
jgi:hypothetical protein